MEFLLQTELASLEVAHSRCLRFAIAGGSVKTKYVPHAHSKYELCALYGVTQRLNELQLWSLLLIATTDLYFDGTCEYSRVTRSFAAFGGSCAPDRTMGHMILSGETSGSGPPTTHTHSHRLLFVVQE